MNLRSLSHEQLKVIKKRTTRANRRFFFFKREANPIHDGVHLNDVHSEIVRRKTERLKMGKC